jgi:hypothetical protein
LGHYQYERSWAGYPLVDVLARVAFDWARGRHPELLSGAYYRPLDTAVPHQFFAASMLVTPVAYGLLGWDPDAPAGRARLAPQLPPQWRQARVRNLPVGASRLDASIEQEPGQLSLRLQARGGRIRVDVRPPLPPGARDVYATVDGAPTSWAGGVDVALGDAARVVELRWAGGLAVEPPASDLEPGQADRGLRVLDFAGEAGGWRLVVEGPAGGSAVVRLHGEVPASAEGATLRPSGGATEATVAFPHSGGPFSRVEVRLSRR